MPTYNGTSNNDFIVGSATADSIYGYGGHDTLIGNGGSDYIDGGDGNDTIIDNDGQTPDTSADSLYGGGGDDTIYAGYLDNAYGGLGVDTLILRLDYTPGAFSIDFSGLWTGATYIIAGATISGFEGFQWITGTQYDDYLISGTPAGRTAELAGLGGSDILVGGAGNDILNADFIYGVGTPNDIYYDELYGLGGDDYLISGLGDYLDGGSGTDRVHLDAAASAAGLTLNFADLLATGSATLAGTTLISIEDVARVSGSLFDDVIDASTDTYDTTLLGRDGDDALLTGSGANTLDGGVGADSMTGGAGNDTYVVDNVGDVVVEYFGGGANDRVEAWITHALAAEVEQLSLSGTAAIDGTGNALNNNMFGNGASNTLSGGAGDDSISGGNGADILIGGSGKDTMTGGAGADEFVFANGDFAGLHYLTDDRISDFRQADGDRIGLSGVDAVAGGADDAFTFIGTGAFTGVAGQLRYGTTGAYTVLYGDTNGDGVEDMMITLNSIISLTASDFYL